MQLQEGFDIGALVLPVLIVVGLCILGLVVWITTVLTRSRYKPNGQSAVPPLSVAQDETPPYTLAIRRSGSEWAVYVKGQRANASTAPFDKATQTEVIEALRELARFERVKIQRSAAPAPVVNEPPAATLPEQPDKPSPASMAAKVGSLSGTAPARPRSNPPTEAPLPAVSLPGMDLAREIGEIVDELIARSPALQNHAVTLMNAQTKGINFVVDGVVYNAVDEIPNAEIQTLIRQATREWERR